MKKTILLLLIIIINSCAQKNNNFTKKSLVIRQYGQKYSIVKVPVVTNKDTTYINEIRFFKITSMANAHKVMYDRFGHWNTSMASNYSVGFPRLIWTDIKLLQNQNSYSVITDGIETPSEYFTSYTIIDADNKDALDVNYTKREQLIECLANGLNNMNDDNSTYSLIRNY
jgi:hypothetical protein